MNNTLHILLIDDEPNDRALVIRELNSEFPNLKVNQIIEAKGFAQALETGHFDLVITDYQLRWSNGLEVLRAFKELYPDLPVIMFTATGNEEIAVEAMKAGLEDYILKSPRHFARLPAAVRSALENARQRRALKEAEVRYQTLFDNVPVGLYRTTPAGQLLNANPTLVQMLGYPDQESLLTVNAADLYMNLEDRRRWQTLMEHEGSVRDFEVQLRRRDGSIIWVENNSQVVRNANGQVQYYEGSMKNITERKQAEDQILASLKEKEVLLKEIHHRVKNNLQIISSLLGLQANYIQDKQALEVFSESQNRIITMALIHELLYQSEDLAQIDFDKYIRNLIGHLFKSVASLSAVTLSLNIDDDVSFDIDTAIPCGLILNELVSNSLKHAFPEGREGEIRIEFTGRHRGTAPTEDNNRSPSWEGLGVGEEFTLIVSDNGVGFPKDLDFQSTESLGLKLVTTLTDQLEGTIELDRSSGTAFKIKFRAKNLR